MAEQWGSKVEPWFFIHAEAVIACLSPFIHEFA